MGKAPDTARGKQSNKVEDTEAGGLPAPPPHHRPTAVWGGLELLAEP